MQKKGLIDSTKIEQIRVHLFSFMTACVLLAVISAGFCLKYSFITSDTSEIQLQTKINPNTAPVCSLIRLPQIGRSRAGAIVAYRESTGRDKAFSICGDLQMVEGIGPVISNQLCEFLRFD